MTIRKKQATRRNALEDKTRKIKGPPPPKFKKKALTDVRHTHTRAASLHTYVTRSHR